MRTPPAGLTQRRYNKAQAEQYAADFDPNKFGLPTVNLRDAIYWIVDGQHRIEALRLWLAPNDAGSVDCNVYQGLNDRDMAVLFAGLNSRRTVNAFDMFMVRCTAEEKRESDIRRIVEAQGLRLSQEKSDGCVSAVSACGKVYDAANDIVLGQALRTIKSAYAGDPVAFDGKVIEGLGLLYNRYNGRTNEKEMAGRLASTQYGVRGLLRRAEAQRERTGNQKAHCVAAVIVEIYNRGRTSKTGRLPAWWKEDRPATEKDA